MPAEAEPSRRLFTRKEYRRMAEVGILKPKERVELIWGEIVTMSPIGARHIAFVNNLNQLLVMRLAGRGIVSVQNPVALDEHSEPQADLAVLRRRLPPYKESEPATDDVVLLIEVGDTSLRYDRGRKLRLYAEAGIPEYWIVDAWAEAVEVYRDPGPEGYGHTQRLTGSMTAIPQMFPDVVLPLIEIFA